MGRPGAGIPPAPGTCGAPRPGCGIPAPRNECTSGWWPGGCSRSPPWRTGACASCPPAAGRIHGR
ncbi:MAG TPA: hypothetical protein DEV75_00455 [Desulfovibrio sp.]|nr:hypothetical protein [Desulfovibrio sp.]